MVARGTTPTRSPKTARSRAAPVTRRARLPAATTQTVAAVLFSGDKWIAMTSPNRYGFVLFGLKAGEPVSIMDDPDMILQAFRWYLSEVGTLAGIGRTTRERGTPGNGYQPVEMNSTGTVARRGRAAGTHVDRTPVGATAANGST